MHHNLPDYLLAVTGSGIFFSTELNPGISFSFVLAHPYQLDLVTSPDPLPGMMTALVALSMLSLQG